MSPNLDILRATAVLYVFVGHLLLVLGFRGTTLEGMGRAGVLIFFVHTSLVLMQSLERSKGPLFRHFYIRRAFRIYPLSMLTVVCLATLKIPSAAWGEWSRYHWIGWKDFFSDLLLCQNLTFSKNILAALWTLPLEVQMYVMLPFLFLLIRKKPPVICYLLWALAGLVAQVQPHYIARASVAQFTPCFLGGVIAYRLSQVVPKKAPAWLWLLVIAGCSTAFIPSPRAKDDGTLSSFLLCLVLGTAIPFFREFHDGWLARTGYQIAKHSYGIYLTHEPIMWLAFDKLHAPPVVQWAVFVILMTAIPIALFRYVEHPMIRLGTRLADRLNQRNRVDVGMPGTQINAKAEIAIAPVKSFRASM